MKLFAVKQREWVATLFGAYVHPLIEDDRTYCGISVDAESKTGISEEFDCPACAAAMR